MAYKIKIYMTINYITNRSANNNRHLPLITLLSIMFCTVPLAYCHICMEFNKICPVNFRTNRLHKISFVYNHSKSSILQIITMVDTKKPRLTKSYNQISNELTNYSTNNCNKPFNIPYFAISEIKIQFTDKENQLIDFLKGCLAHYKIETVLRIAGGWVRDKILGYNCNDIDIALSNMTGVEFANLLSEYNMKHSGKSIGFGVIEKRPEHSKHLETVALQIGGLQVDFVNLRHDSYTSDDNRIPEIRIGTEKEDAYRRDFTVNSLFYNINTGQLEDFTGMGLDDLRNGIIRTPLDPVVTFLDDPLRIVRAIRFATRFGFQLTDQIIDASSKSEITNAFMKKVTRSRLSNEIYNILVKSDQPQSFHLLNKFNLLPWLAELPKGVNYTIDISNLTHSNQWISKGIKYMYIGKQLSTNSRNKLPFATISNEIIDSFYIALFVKPISTIQYYNKIKPIDLTDYVIKESLKLRKRHYIQSKELNANSLLFKTYIDDIDSLDKVERGELGYMIRTCGKYWKESFFINFITYIYDNSKNNDYQSLLNNIDNYADKHIKLYNKIIDMGLDKAHEIQPKLKGDDIKKLLPKITCGAVFKEVIISHIKYLLQNPNCTIDEACNYLKNEYKYFV